VKVVEPIVRPTDPTLDGFGSQRYAHQASSPGGDCEALDPLWIKQRIGMAVAALP